MIKLKVVASWEPHDVRAFLRENPNMYKRAVQLFKDAYEDYRAKHAVQLSDKDAYKVTHTIPHSFLWYIERERDVRTIFKLILQEYVKDQKFKAIVIAVEQREKRHYTYWALDVIQVIAESKEDVMEVVEVAFTTTAPDRDLPEVALDGVLNRIQRIKW